MNVYNKYSGVCADEADLRALESGALDGDSKIDLIEHISICDACALMLDLISVGHSTGNEDSWEEELSVPPELLKNISVRSRKQIDAERKLTIKALAELGVEGIETGQIWRTRVRDIVLPTPDGEELSSVFEMGSVPHLVVVVNPFFQSAWSGESERHYRVIEVIPVSDNIEYAGDDDIVFTEDESPIGYPIMLEMWNRQKMIAKNLDACLATIENMPESLANRNASTNFAEYLSKTPAASEAADYSWFSLVKRGIYHDPKMRFRAREYESTAYLRDSVFGLNEAVYVAEGEPTEDERSWRRWQGVVAWIIPPPVYGSHAVGSAASDTVDEDKSEGLFFDGKLKSNKKRLAVNQYEFLLRSTAPDMANKFVLVISGKKPAYAALLSETDTYPGEYRTSLGFTVPNFGIDSQKVYTASELSIMLSNREINSDLISASISAVNPAGLSAWLRVAETLPPGDPVRVAILAHTRIA